MADSEPTILLKSGWNRYNFGDIAHTPGFLRLAQMYLPEAHVIVWASSYPEWLTNYLMVRFPKVEVVSGNLGVVGAQATSELTAAFERADIFIYNSGPIFNHGHEVVDGVVKREGWRSFNWNSTVEPLLPCVYAKAKGIPFGIFGQSFIHFAPPGDVLVANILSQAAFISTRETDSLRYIKRLGFATPDMGFTPDAAWAMDLCDDETVLPWIQRVGLAEGRFLAVTTRGVPAGVSLERDKACQQALWAEIVHCWLSQTDMPIVLVPETVQSIELNKGYIAEAVPAKARHRVIMDDTLWGDTTEFWIPDQANSILKRAFAYVNVDHHGALQSLAAGVPTLHPYQPQAGRKKWVFNDLGLNDWLIDTYSAEAPAQTAAALSCIIKDRPAAVKRACKAAEQVVHLQRQRFEAIREIVMP